MKKDRIQGFLLDVDYVQKEKDSVIRVWVRTEKGLEKFFDKNFSPYIYAILSKEAEKAKKELLAEKFAEFEIKGIQAVKRRIGLNEKEEDVLKIAFNSTKDLVIARKELEETKCVKELREHRIPFAKRYLIDRDLMPLSKVELLVDDEKNVMEIKIKENSKVNGEKISDETGKEKEIELNIGCFDLETLSPERFSNPEKDPIIMASYADAKGCEVFCEKKIPEKFVKQVENEAEMIKEIVKRINAPELDVVGTYNGDKFDLPYIKVRGEKLGERVPEISLKKKGLEHAVALKGKQHVDGYQIARILNRLGVVNLVKMDLESVSEAVFGKWKEKVHADEINEIWRKGNETELARLARYNKEDGEVTYKLISTYLHLFVELGKIVKMNLFDVTRAASSSLVESLLVIKSAKQGILLPQDPDENIVKQRMMQSYEGGFVKEPVRGLHENIAVLDFSSLHPTIMISHNISPDTIDCGHAECREKNSAPSKNYFCTKRKGFFSSILQELFEKRMMLKKEMKKLDKKSKEFKLMDAEQFSLKILLNSFYGALGYPRFKWYSRECARAITAWSREYANMVGREAEKTGLEWIYGDTDSAFLKIPQGKTQEDVKKFVEEINSKLPGVMNLELEGFFKRGIFVTKKGAAEAAKKKYALIDEKGNLKIVGFEYVRRDWSRIAKETQKKVIKSILEEGKPEKAVEIVKLAIKELKEGKVLKKELIIYTQIQRPIEKYESIGPHVAAAKKAIAKGKQIEVGSVIEYVVTKNGKSISDKAEMAEYVKEGNYDADYYITHQVIPAVIKIIGEFGFTEQDLIEGGKQKTLHSFFS